MEWTEVCITTKWENLVGSLATEQSHLLFHQPDPLLYQQHGLDEKLIIINNCNGKEVHPHQPPGSGCSVYCSSPKAVPPPKWKKSMFDPKA